MSSNRVKSSKRSGSRRKAGRNSQAVDPTNLVRVRSKFTQTQSMNPSTSVTNLGGLTTSATGIWSTDQQVAALSDMFRLFKINDVQFEFSPMTTTGSAAVNVPAGMLMIKFEGANAPSTLTDIEQPMVSELTVPWSALAAAGSEALTREVSARLHAKNGDFAILQGPSGPGDKGFLSTQDDGTQTTFGTLFWCFLTTAASSTLTYFLRSVFDISFKDILDPSTISSMQRKRIQANLNRHLHLQLNGLGRAFEWGEGTLQNLTMAHMVVPAPMLTSGDNGNSSPTDDEVVSKAKDLLAALQFSGRSQV